jgi:hypothetical protein
LRDDHAIESSLQRLDRQRPHRTLAVIAARQFDLHRHALGTVNWSAAEHSSSAAGRSAVRCRLLLCDFCTCDTADYTSSTWEGDQGLKPTFDVDSVFGTSTVDCQMRAACWQFSNYDLHKNTQGEIYPLAATT